MKEFLIEEAVGIAAYLLVTLIGLLGAAGGVGVLSTNVVHALIPLPGFGATVFMPLAAACLVIARARVRHPLAGGLTRTVQQLVIFFLPGGSPTAHNPFLLPLMVVDGFLLDLIHRRWPADLSTARVWSGLLCAACGAVGTVVQVGVLALFVGRDQFLLGQGLPFFVALFVGFHSLLRFVGGMIGSRVLQALPERTV